MTINRRTRLLAALVLVGVLALLLHAGGPMRGAVGIVASPESLRAYVQSLGPVAPLMFLGMVTFRSVLLLPSSMVLTAGGLAFGALPGALLGGLGLVASALWCFGVARVLGREWVQSRIPERLRPFEARAEAIGPPLIGLSTAHPMGSMTPLYFAAGLTRVRLLPFLLACGIAGPLRAGLYSWFGAQLLDFGSPRFWAASAALVAAALLPLAHPGVRRWLLMRPAAKGAPINSGSGPA